MNHFLRVLFLLWIIMPVQTWGSKGREEIVQVENYLNGLTTLTAFFTQLNPNGSLSEGQFYLSRPGRLRFTYTRPQTQLIIADGQNMIFYDKSHDETSIMPLSSSPAAFLLKEKVKLGPGTDTQVTNIQHQKNRLKMTFIKREDPGAGTLTLTFSKNPFQLIQWIIVDGQRLETVVNLDEVQAGKPLNSDLFVFNFSRK